MQTICGSHGMYEHHVALVEGDVRELREGVMDVVGFVRGVCSGAIQRRVLPVASMHADIEAIDGLDPGAWK